MKYVIEIVNVGQVTWQHGACPGCTDYHIFGNQDDALAFFNNAGEDNSFSVTNMGWLTEDEIDEIGGDFVYRKWHK